jgi:hypothetical protein
MISLAISSRQVSSAGVESDQSHFGRGGADTSVAVVRRGVGDSMAIRAIHGARSTLACTPQSDGTHLSLLVCPTAAAYAQIGAGY